jgi:two-component system, sporulation sensor kinase D
LKSKQLYSSKQIWKIILSIFAMVIIGLSLWYTNYLAKKIQEEERLRVKLWSETVKKQAELVNLTNQTFEQLKAEERDNIQDWVFALKEFNREQEDYTFITSFMTKKNNVMKIIELVKYDSGIKEVSYTSEDISIKPENFESKIEYEDSIRKIINEWDIVNPSIKVPNTLQQTQIIHYGNSKLFIELKSKSDSLITSFENDLITNTASIPILYIDSSSGKIRKTINIKDQKLKDSATIFATINELKKENNPIYISFGENNTGIIYYAESTLLKQLRFYPLLQLIIILLFLMVSYFLFSTFRKAEQNQVWAGMAKETAHQLGTPLSSLMAWLEIIKADGVPESSIIEMNKDINRLNTITERFSKIGSDVITTKENIFKEVSKSVNYLTSRVSKKVDLFVTGDKNASAKINSSLFEWIIENLTKNAIDAIQGKDGSITYRIEETVNKVIIDVIDTGKGIPTASFKTIFNPGYSTKERGWGLGLSLVKRIVEEQLNGKINVLNSKIDQGTTFRITLKK